MDYRERILSVYRGETPDVVPFMLDLSHWFYERTRVPWDLSAAYEEPERDLIEYHRKTGVGFYLANLASFYTVTQADDVDVTTTKSERDGVPEITWRIQTPLGSIERSRIWEPRTYAWGISRWGIETEQNLSVFRYAMATRSFQPRWDRYQAWVDEVGDAGADCGDAITPTPIGDLTPAECRAEAGPDFILSGGVSPDLWLPNVPLNVFTDKVIKWLDLRRESPRLIANAGDQVPPGADEDRIKIMRDLVEEHERY